MSLDEKIDRILELLDNPTQRSFEPEIMSLHDPIPWAPAWECEPIVPPVIYRAGDGVLRERSFEWVAPEYSDDDWLPAVPLIAGNREWELELARPREPIRVVPTDERPVTIEPIIREGEAFDSWPFRVQRIDQVEGFRVWVGGEEIHGVRGVVVRAGPPEEFTFHFRPLEQEDLQP